MRGDDLAVYLAAISIGVPFLWDAAKGGESGWRRATAIILGVASLLFAAFWLQIKQWWPAFSLRVSAVVTNQETWALVIVLLIGLFWITSPALGHYRKKRVADDPARSRIDDLAEQISELHKNPPSPARPEMRLAYIGSNVFVPTVEPCFTGIAIDLRVWNTGKPGKIMEWGLIVIPPDGQKPAIAQLTRIPETLTASGSKVSAVVRAQDALYTKTLEADVGMDPITGTLLFYAALQKNVVTHPDTRWEITAKDAYGKPIFLLVRVGDSLSR